MNIKTINVSNMFQPLLRKFIFFGSPKSFNSSMTKKVGPKKIAIPYTDVVSYLGYANLGSEDEIKDGKKFYYKCGPIKLKKCLFIFC